ncbi:hypothetical protein SAMN05428642_103449 [Flaviramulus basaltis]|uniref:Uncharacterized protein n=1 Tax=Flaviramulus basaltis TaxID=369401 RepID=A0A1K2INC8_9FLAO|nr:DUF6090 family protein [Flaviramulus basaltis]SFZ93949.1 hypothetical protein SAMN05428642_103449 [Flaviramulus basaltis]
MIKLFRNIRENLLNEGKTSKYFKYAIGEILLVVIGILIALQINNWNEARKDENRMHTNINSISEDIKSDAFQIEKAVAILKKQMDAGRNIIPVMESKNKVLADSLKFILDFNSFTTTPIISETNNTWDFLNSSGNLSEFPDSRLLKMLQDYYRDLKAITVDFTNSANPVRLELRKLKYELFTNTEHRKFFPTSTPKAPNKEVYNAIFEDKRILPLCRFIASTSTYFEAKAKSLENKNKNILDYLDKNYGYSEHQ